MTILLLAGTTIALAATSASATAHAAGPTDRTESAVTGSSPVTGVAESVVRVRIPLSASIGPHPADCDWLSYLRYRSVRGPARSADAERILVAQPGILAGASSFDSVARNTVSAAEAAGHRVEFWALDRRSNCLEDHTGIAAGLRASDPHRAVDYYSRGRSVDGHRFAGYRNNDQVGWLAGMGIEQTVRDEYDLLRAEVPSQSQRKQKVLCGGHSLGGVITGFFADADFDGDAATLGDAGYNQCAGYFALDSSINTSLADLNGMPTGPDGSSDLGYRAVQAGLASGALPRTLSLPVVINPETMNLLGIAGLAARVDPGGQSDLARYIPGDNVRTTLRVLFSRDLTTFVQGFPTAADFRITNDAGLGILLDDQSQPLSFLQASVGFFAGGPVADKDFPLPHDAVTAPALGGVAPLALGVERKAIPATPHGPMYTWRNYDRIGGTAIPRSRDGSPFTSPAREVTDIRELARSLSEHPLDFTEWYFPTRLVTDVQGSSPQIARLLVHPQGLRANPVINLIAGDGLVGSRATKLAGTTVVAPGYQHLDVLTAAPRQNAGHPELLSTALARFAVR